MSRPPSTDQTLSEQIPPPLGPPGSLTFLLDVDNTLLDNDRLKSDIGERIAPAVGPERAQLFWKLYEEVRQAQDYVDYPTAARRFGAAVGDDAQGERVLRLIESMDFPSYLYPGALGVLAHLGQLGTTVILSDGDQIFQPLKIRASGLEAAVGGNVLIYVHKEDRLSDVFTRYPAGHYVVVDDKPRILAALETCCPTSFTTIMVLQGHYAVQGEYSPAPDYIVPTIGALLDFTRDQFLAGAHGSSPAEA